MIGCLTASDCVDQMVDVKVEHVVSENVSGIVADLITVAWNEYEQL